MISLLKYNRLQIGIAILFLISLSLFQSCCPCDDPTDSACPNYDPCLEVKPPIANFGAGYKYFIPGSEQFFGFYPDSTIYLDGDTIPGTSTFYSYTEEVDSFYWKVGDDPRVFRGKEFFLDFDDELRSTPIDVELIVLKRNECFNEGFIQDTIEKNLIISSLPYESPSIQYFNNKYYGVSTEFPNDSFEIDYRDTISWIENMPRGTNGNTALYRRDYDEAHFTGQSNKTIWLGNAKFQPEDRRKIVIRYKVSYDLGETSNWYTYEGYRVD